MVKKEPIIKHVYNCEKIKLKIKLKYKHKENVRLYRLSIQIVYK